jgi:hypothetical protein
MSESDLIAAANRTSGAPLVRIIHPSDFSAASRIAFTHALKIALHAQAELCASLREIIARTVFALVMFNDAIVNNSQVSVRLIRIRNCAKWKQRGRKSNWRPRGFLSSLQQS